MDYRTWPIGDASLIDIVLEMVSRCHSSQADDIQRGVDLISYLLPFYHHAPSVVNPIMFNDALVKMNSAEDDKAMAPYLEVIRSILRQSQINPFEYVASISYRITLEKADLGIAKLLMNQVYHPLDPDHDIDGLFLENDRQMLADPKGIAMRDALRNGARYQTASPLCRINSSNRPTGIHALIDAVAQSANHTRHSDIEMCCRHRIVSFIECGSDIDAPRTSYYASSSYAYGPVSRLSALQFAIVRNLEDFLRGALEQAGWSQNKIAAHFQQDIFGGLPELFGGVTDYKTQQECREEFARSLIRGHFLHHSETSIEEVDNEAVMSMGIAFGEISRVVKDANAAFKMKSTPGSWKESGAIRILPGIDFDPMILPLDSRCVNDKMDIRLWLPNEEAEAE
jgi:hypothetical protein